jgi:hypothetical protein
MQQHKTSRGREDAIKIEEISSKSFIKKKERGGKTFISFQSREIYVFVCDKVSQNPKQNLLEPLRNGSG